jgi:hypothetical protein
MGYFSDLDIALTPLIARLSPWSHPSLCIQVTDDASLIRAVPHQWRAQVNRWLTVEWWCMGPGCWMGEDVAWR